MHGDVRVFDRFAPLYDLFVPSADPAVLTAGLSHAERTVERLLDVGGGTGRGARALSRYDPVVVDAAPGMLRKARGHGLAVVRGDAGRLPVGDESVDAVIVTDAMHHFGDVDAALTEARRVLRPGGVLVVRDFDPTTVRGWWLVTAEHLFGFDSTFYSPESLARKFDDAGLTPHVPDDGFGYTLAGVAE